MCGAACGCGRTQQRQRVSAVVWYCKAGKKAFFAFNPPPAPQPNLRCRQLFEELSKVGSFEQQGVCKHFLDQVDPTIRWVGWVDG